MRTLPPTVGALVLAAGATPQAHGADTPLALRWSMHIEQPAAGRPPAAIPAAPRTGLGLRISTALTAPVGGAAAATTSRPLAADTPRDSSGLRTEADSVAAGATAAPSGVYRDQLIGLQGDEEAAAPGFEAPEPGPPGAYGLTYRFWHDDIGTLGSTTEHGVSGYWWRQDLDYGLTEIRFEGLTGSGRRPFGSDGGRFLLAQRGYVLPNEWIADAELGHLRAVASPLAAGSYRFRLPSSLIGGTRLRVQTEHGALSLTAGGLGRLQGTAAQAFSLTDGSLVGLSAERRLGAAWRAAAEVWRTDGARGVEDHTSVLGMVEHRAPGRGPVHQVRALADGRGRYGGWLDGQWDHGRWSHRYGLFRFDPGLLWTDQLIENDREGLYWRGDYRSFRWAWAFGSDISRNNLDGRPDRSGDLRTSTFASATWQYRRDTQLGATVRLGSRHADSGLSRGDGYAYGLRVFASQRFGFGLTRVEALLAVEDEVDDGETAYGLRWDQEWDVGPLWDLRSDSELSWTDSGDDQRRLRVSGGRVFDNGLQASGQLQLDERHTARGTETRTGELQLDLGWRFRPDWLLALTARAGRGDVTTPRGVDVDLRETSVLLSLSYAQVTGQRPVFYGRQTGRPGAGAVTGVVFLDENANGRLDPSERTLAGVPVILARRFTVETDRDGRYTFRPVRVGEHLLTIRLDDVPLPWGLDDERPRPVSVDVRDERQADFALQRLDR